SPLFIRLLSPYTPRSTHHKLAVPPLLSSTVAGESTRGHEYRTVLGKETITNEISRSRAGCGSLGGLNQSQKWKEEHLRSRNVIFEVF
ncbi:hypothetical protein Moror_3702, partial [Moniliophthora roreri MCA 2997]